MTHTPPPQVKSLSPVVDSFVTDISVFDFIILKTFGCGLLSAD